MTENGQNEAANGFFVIFHILSCLVAPPEAQLPALIWGQTLNINNFQTHAASLTKLATHMPEPIWNQTLLTRFFFFFFFISPLLLYRERLGFGP